MVRRRISFSIGGLRGVEVVEVPAEHSCVSDEVYAAATFEQRCLVAGLDMLECQCCVDPAQFDWCDMESEAEV